MRYHVQHYQSGLLVGAVTTRYRFEALDDIYRYADDNWRDDGLDCDGEYMLIDDLEKCTLRDDYLALLERESLRITVIASSKNCYVTLAIDSRW